MIRTALIVCIGTGVTMAALRIGRKAGKLNKRTLPVLLGVLVLLTGGITTVQDAEALLQEGAADLIGVGRAMLKTPDWAVQALA